MPEGRFKTKFIEKVRVPKGDGILRHMLVCAKNIEFTGNFTLRLSKAPGDMKDFLFISDIINEKLGVCGLLWFSFKGKKPDIVHRDGDTMSITSTLTNEFSHPHPHGRVPKRHARHQLGQHETPPCLPNGGLSWEE